MDATCLKHPNFGHSVRDKSLNLAALQGGGRHRHPMRLGHAASLRLGFVRLGWTRNAPSIFGRSSCDHPAGLDSIARVVGRLYDGSEGEKMPHNLMPSYRRHSGQQRRQRRRSSRKPSMLATGLGPRPMVGRQGSRPAKVRRYACS
jgi:hypothetical protein